MNEINCERCPFFGKPICDSCDCGVEKKMKGLRKMPQIIHYPYKNLYLCNQAYYANKKKISRDKTKITCKNCIHKLKVVEK